MKLKIKKLIGVFLVLAMLFSNASLIIQVSANDFDDAWNEVKEWLAEPTVPHKSTQNPMVMDLYYGSICFSEKGAYGPTATGKRFVHDYFKEHKYIIEGASNKSNSNKNGYRMGIYGEEYKTEFGAYPTIYLKNEDGKALYIDTCGSDGGKDYGIPAISVYSGAVTIVVQCKTFLYGGSYSPAIYVAKGARLNLILEEDLLVVGGYFASGIGGGHIATKAAGVKENGGIIDITAKLSSKSLTLNAVAGEGMAELGLGPSAIGACQNTSTEAIYIHQPTLTEEAENSDYTFHVIADATESYGAGIGSATGVAAGVTNIEIGNPVSDYDRLGITATGGYGGAGIGGAKFSNKSSIEIYRGSISAIGGYGAAGIGGGYQSKTENWVVYSDASSRSPSMDLYSLDSKVIPQADICVKGGTVTAIGGYNASAIGGGADETATIFDNYDPNESSKVNSSNLPYQNNIILGNTGSNSTVLGRSERGLLKVTAIAGTNASAIGGGNNGSSNIKVLSGMITAKSGESSDALGAGSAVKSNTKTIVNIKSGTVYCPNSGIAALNQPDKRIKTDLTITGGSFLPKASLVNKIEAYNGEKERVYPVMLESVYYVTELRHDSNKITSILNGEKKYIAIPGADYYTLEGSMSVKADLCGKDTVNAIDNFALWLPEGEYNNVLCSSVGNQFPFNGTSAAGSVGHMKITAGSININDYNGSNYSISNNAYSIATSLFGLDAYKTGPDSYNELFGLFEHIPQFSGISESTILSRYAIKISDESVLKVVGGHIYALNTGTANITITDKTLGFTDSGDILHSSFYSPRELTVNVTVNLPKVSGTVKIINENSNTKFYSNDTAVADISAVTNIKTPLITWYVNEGVITGEDGTTQPSLKKLGNGEKYKLTCPIGSRVFYVVEDAGGNYSGSIQSEEIIVSAMSVSFPVKYSYFDDLEIKITKNGKAYDGKINNNYNNIFAASVESITYPTLTDVAPDEIKEFVFTDSHVNWYLVSKDGTKKLDQNDVLGTDFENILTKEATKSFNGDVGSTAVCEVNVTVTYVLKNNSRVVCKASKSVVLGEIESAKTSEMYEVITPTLLSRTDTSFTIKTVSIVMQSGYDYAPSAYYYSIDGVNWQRDGVFSGLKPNTVYPVFYYQDVCGNFARGDTFVTSFSTAEPPKRPTPNAYVDISTNSLCGVTEAMKYSVNSQTDWVDITGNSAIISEKLKFGDIVYVKAFGDGGISFYDSDIQEIAIKQAESPKYKVIYPTANNPYGQLNFPGSTMQYRKKGESEWNTAKDTINKLTVGNWELRAAPYGKYTAGEVLELNVFTVSDNALLSSIGYELNGESYTLNKYQMELAMTDAG